MLEPLQTPTSLHAEKTVLGACLVDDIALEDAADALQPSDFFTDGHRRIFSAILAVRKAGSAPDIITVSEYLVDRKEIDAVGGRAYVVDLPTGLPRKLNIADKIRIVRDKSRARELINLAERAADEASDGQEEAQIVIERAIEEFRELAEQHPSMDLQSVGTYLASQGDDSEALEAMATTGGLMLGWTQWDECTGGLQPGELVVLAAMASSGKTAWACNVAYYASVIMGKITAYFPLEDGRGAVVRRMVSSASGVDHRAIRDANLNQYDQARVLEYRARLAAAPLYLDETQEMTMSRIRAKCARLKRQGLAAGHPTGLDLIIIDQLTHVENTDVFQKNVNPEEIIGRQAHAAKKIAKELQVPVILLAQSTQESAKRTDPTPRITDLAGSGKIKNHADIVAFLHRPELFSKDDEALKGIGHMILAKNRQGETRTCVCAYRAKILRWEDESAPTPRQTDFEAYRAAYRD